MAENQNIKLPRQIKDIRNQRFGKLVVREYEKTVNHKVFWICDCDCGNETVSCTGNLRSGSKKSCGCLAGKHKITHGMSRTSEFSVWIGIRKRCLNKNNRAYHNYGGRGIKICKRWMKFKNFYADMGPRPAGKTSIDRIDNNKGYSRQNCRWSNSAEQSLNRRTNVKIEFNGILKTISEWAKSAGISRSAMRSRILNGVPLKEALTLPRRKTKSLKWKHKT